MLTLLSNKKLTLKRRSIIITILCIVFLGFIIFYINRKLEFPVSPIVQEMFQYLDIENCYISNIEDYRDIAVQLEEPAITDSEVDKYIDEILIDYDQESITLDFVKREFVMIM